MERGTLPVFRQPSKPLTGLLPLRVKVKRGALALSVKGGLTNWTLRLEARTAQEPLITRELTEIEERSYGAWSPSRGTLCARSMSVW